MIVNRQLAKSSGTPNKDLWSTPWHIFEALDKEFHFTLDPCCEEHTAKCWKYFTRILNGLTQDWAGETVFCNPPYSRGNIDLWVEKCFEESKKENTIVVALLPVSTSADWFHKWICGKSEIRFINKRVRFEGGQFTAPFSSMIVIFGGRDHKSFKQTSFGINNKEVENE